MRSLLSRLERLEEHFGDRCACICDGHNPRTAEGALILNVVWICNDWTEERKRAEADRLLFTCPAHGQQMPRFWAHFLPQDEFT
jgi:hypothetical protein